MKIALTPIQFDDGTIGFQDAGSGVGVGLLRWGTGANGRKAPVYDNATAFGALPAWRAIDRITVLHLELLVTAGPEYTVPGLRFSAGSTGAHRVRVETDWDGRNRLECHRSGTTGEIASRTSDGWVGLDRRDWRRVVFATGPIGIHATKLRAGGAR